MQSLSWAQNRGQGYWKGHEIFPIQCTHPVFCGEGLQPCPQEVLLRLLREHAAVPYITGVRVVPVFSAGSK